MISLPVYLYSSDMFGLTVTENRLIYGVSSFGAALLLAKTYSNTQRKSAKELFEKRCTALDEASNHRAAHRQEQLHVLRDTIPIETMAYACFLNNSLFILSFLFTSVYLLPKLHFETPLALSYLISLSVASVLVYTTRQS